MPLPEISRGAVLLLLSVDQGVPIVTSGGRACLIVGGEPQPIRVDSLADLENRGWIEHGEGVVKLTSTGKYWAKRYGQQLSREIRTAIRDAYPDNCDRHPGADALHV